MSDFRFNLSTTTGTLSHLNLIARVIVQSTGIVSSEHSLRPNLAGPAFNTAKGKLQRGFDSKDGVVCYMCNHDFHYPMFPNITPNSYGLYTAQPQPCSKEFHAERSYLLSSLQQENIKATDLLRKLPPLEEKLAFSEIAYVRRRARKQIGWLRYRINETTRQERTILNRLAQLAQEIQERGQRNQFECEQRHPYHGQAFSNPASLCLQRQQLHFTPITPPYQPQEFPFPLVHTQQQHQPRGFP